MHKLTAALFIAATIAVAHAADFTISSPDVKSGAMISKAQVFNGSGCQGSNISPALQWSGAPAGTKSYAVTMYDPDAPTDSGLWHWVIFDIPASVSGLPSGAGNSPSKAPSGSRQVRNDYGFAGYGGPCPPQGSQPHHYQIKVYALDVPQLDLPRNATPAMVGLNLNAHKLGVAELTALYGR